MHHAGSQSFENMAASYISLASRRYLEDQLNTQSMHDRVLREVDNEASLMNTTAEESKSQNENDLEDPYQIDSSKPAKYHGPNDEPI